MSDKKLYNKDSINKTHGQDILIYLSYFLYNI